MRPWEIAVNRRPPTAPLNQRRFLGEPCNTPVHLRRSPPVRRQWGSRDRLVVLHNALLQDDNFHHPLFSQQHQQVLLDEARQYSHTSAPPRMLHPAAHPPQHQQTPIMVDLHDQIAPGIRSHLLHCYHGDDARFPHPHRATSPRVQQSAAPSMLGNVQRTALSALLPSSSCEFEKEELECQ
uniref:Uncharacterized protein n=1 Tax=Hucho hucho TaxID=62062 RepID=A0A4W5L545_9TELE